VSKRSLAPLNSSNIGCKAISQGGLPAISVEAIKQQENSRRMSPFFLAHQNWRPSEPSKTALARELWPVLRSKLDAAASDPAADLPPIAEALISAF
jgi:hypothetical protein